VFSSLGQRTRLDYDKYCHIAHVMQTIKQHLKDFAEKAGQG
jgi:hypothetical protein